jgi:hypothetical protein
LLKAIAAQQYFYACRPNHRAEAFLCGRMLQGTVMDRFDSGIVRTDSRGMTAVPRRQFEMATDDRGTS